MKWVLPLKGMEKGGRKLKAKHMSQCHFKRLMMVTTELKAHVAKDCVLSRYMVAGPEIRDLEIPCFSQYDLRPVKQFEGNGWFDRYLRLVGFLKRQVVKAGDNNTQEVQG